ncbi:MAG: amino acid ABC transporter permease [Lachnospiraceae bacterium]|nr:amino acid ABC transporter permease [Lachnospiraceae bacterium]
MLNVFDWRLIFTNIPKLMKYLPVTLEVAVLSYLLSLITGLLVAMVKIRKPRILYPLVCFYVSFTRGTPILVQLYATYFGLPMILQLINYKFGTSFSTGFIPNIVFALVALTMNDAAYSSEYIRASIESVDKGQREAAYSIGMTNLQTLKRIIIPEALVVALPSLGNSLISLIKGTSLVFTCAVVDITAGGRLIAGRNYRYFEMYLSLAIVYWIITFIVSRVFAFFERKLKCNEREVLADDRN